MAVAVGGASVPVVADIIKEVQTANGAVLSVHAATHRPVAAVAVDEQVVVPRTDASVDGGSITVVCAVRIVLMSGNAQCLADDAVLERHVQGSATRDRLVGAPGCRTVVHNGVVGSRHTHRITCILAIDAESALKTHVATDDVGADIDVRGLDADALSRCRLSGNVCVGLGEVRREVEFDDAADVEHDIARLVHLGKSVEQRARFLAAAERGDVVHHTAASANGIASVALGIGECQMTGLESPHRSFVDVALAVNLVDAPPVALHRRQAVLHIRGSRAFIFVAGGVGYFRRVGSQHHLMADDTRGSRP